VSKQRILFFVIPK